MELRPYQKEAKEAVFEQWGNGIIKTLLVLPTGCGKTIVFAKITEDCVRNGDRVLILAHRGELLDQAADKIAKATGLRCATEKAEQSCLGSWFRITVGSVQSLMRETRLKRFPEDYFNTIIIDEAHVNILSGEVAKLTAQFARRSRKYKTCLIVATQEPKDFSASEEVLIHGKAIFNNSAYKLIMNLDLDAMKDVSKLVDLNPNEQYMIQRFGRGQGLFVVGNRRIPINVLASKEELEAIGGLS